MIDISCVLTAHREGRLLYPALQSLQRSREHAQKNRICSELIIVLDDADQLTGEIVKKQAVGDATILPVSFGDPAGSRNFAVSRCNGKYIAFLDGDDLWCRNWLTAAYDVAERTPGDSVIHPAYNVYFGGDRQVIFKHVDSASPSFLPEIALEKNYWTALSFAHISIFQRTPYQKNDLSSGFGYEDWVWNCETLDRGCIHKVADETVHFIRKKKRYQSRSEMTNENHAIPRIYDLYGFKSSISVENIALFGSRSTNTLAFNNSESRSVEHFLEWSIVRSKVIGIFETDNYCNGYLKISLNGAICCEGNFEQYRDSENTISVELSDIPGNSVSHIEVLVCYREQEIHKVTLYYCPLVDVYRDRIRQIFFADFYASKYAVSHCGKEKTAFRHFLNFGLYKDYMPNPWFDPGYYREKYPHKLTDIAIPLLSFLTCERRENLKPCHDVELQFYRESNRITDESAFLHYVNSGNRTRLNASPDFDKKCVGEELGELAGYESSLSDFNIYECREHHYPIMDRLSHTPVALKQQYDNSIDYMVCISSVSEIDRMSLSCILAIQEKIGKQRVLVCVTDESETDATNRLPSETLLVFLDKELTMPKANLERKAWVLHALAALLCPEKIVNFNSRSGWTLFTRFGRQLYQRIRLIGAISSTDCFRGGAARTANSKFLNDSIEWLELILTDNSEVIQEIKSLCEFSDALMNKFHCLRSTTIPVDMDDTAKATPINNVVWMIDKCMPTESVERVVE